MNYIDSMSHQDFTLLIYLAHAADGSNAIGAQSNDAVPLPSV